MVIILLFKYTEGIGADGNTLFELSMAPASLTEFYRLFPVSSSEGCSSASGRL
jgi:hypothetical protein